MISSQTPPRKMRKGTRSCVECRRRKVRCISTTSLPACNHCLYRKTECYNQEGRPFAIGGDKSSIDKSRRSEDDELSRILGQVLQRLHKNGQALSADNQVDMQDPLRMLQSELLPSTVEAEDVGTDEFTTPATSHSSYTTEKAVSRAPALSLFDVALLSQANHERGFLTTKNRHHHNLEDKSSRVIHALTALTAQTGYLHLALEASPDLGKTSLSAFPDVFGPEFEGFTIARQSILVVIFVQQTLAEGNIAKVAKAILHLALCLQQIPGRFDSSRMTFPVPLETLRDQYLTSAETLIALDEGFACSFDGIECMITQSKCYVNVGKPRKAWMTLRRAVGCAHLLGLHLQPMGAVGAKHRRGRSLWQTLCILERFLSVTLGLPSSIPQCQMPSRHPSTGGQQRPHGEHLMLQLSIMVGRVIDRNHDPHNLDSPITVTLDQELEDLKSALPPGWWEASHTPTTPSDSLYDMSLAKFWYDNVRRLLHLPFLLNSANDPRYTYNRMAALESSREMIRHYRILRHSKRPVLTICDVVDYITFTAAMSLVINLMGDPRQILATQDDFLQRERDWDIVHEFRDDMKRFSEERPCSVATQIARLLDDFSRARFEGWPALGDETYHVVIPYFGKVLVGRSGSRSQWTDSSATAAQYQQTYQNRSSTLSDVPLEASGPTQGVEGETQAYLGFESFLQPIPEGDRQLWDELMGGMDWNAAGVSYGEDLRGDWGWVVD